MNGEIIIIMCEISHTPNCTEWMANWRDLPLFAILGGLAPWLFHFFAVAREESRKNLESCFIASLRCWKIMSCDETPSHCCATPLFTSRLNSHSAQKQKKKVFWHRRNVSTRTASIWFSFGCCSLDKFPRVCFRGDRSETDNSRQLRLLARQPTKWYNFVPARPRDQ